MAPPVPHPEAGTFPIDTGTAELLGDEYFTNGWILKINGVLSSHVVVGAPEILAFEYMEWIAAFVEWFVDDFIDPTTLRMTHLGGAACSMPRYFAALWPRSRHSVVELDGALAALVRTWFDIPRSPTVKIRVGDAREVVESLVAQSRDIVIRDVFSGAVTPTRMTTAEFFAQVKRTLAPGGLYIANCGDYSDLRGVKAELAGMSEVFNYCAAIADPPMLKGRRYGNVILIGTDTELPAETDPKAAQLAARLLRGAVTAQYKGPSWVRAFIAGAAARRDTDSEANASDEASESRRRNLPNRSAT